MKYLVAIVILIGVHTSSFAHKFYFGFAEVEYNMFSQRFEATITVTSHDLEMALKSNGTDAGDLTELDSAQSSYVEAYINRHFVFSSNENTCSFHLVGHENNLDGTSFFYLESSEIPLGSTLTIEFNMLMEQFPEQQNKVTLFYKDQTYTVAFTKPAQEQIIQILNNEEE